MTDKIISVAKDFSTTPAGRYISDGSFSGETFRKKLLKPAYLDSSISKVIIDLNGLEGVGSSFWEEAFGGLMREYPQEKKKIMDKISFICSDDLSLEPLIYSYMEEELKRNL